MAASIVTVILLEIRAFKILPRIYFWTSALGSHVELCFRGFNIRQGSTASQAAAPSALSVAATRKGYVQRRCWAMTGVSSAVTAPPNCAPMFMKPEADPALGPAISAVTDQ